MKTAVVQIYVDLKGYSNPDLMPKFDDLSKVSFDLAKKYSQKVKAEYFLITDPRVNYIHPTYERFTLFEDPYWTDNFDQILYLDSDVFIYDTAPNIFEMYSSLNNFKVCQHWSEVRYKHKGVLPGSHTFNAGVFILTKHSRDVMLQCQKLPRCIFLSCLGRRQKKKSQYGMPSKSQTTIKKF
jgi:hypothetical protein